MAQHSESSAELRGKQGPALAHTKTQSQTLTLVNLPGRARRAAQHGAGSVRLRGQQGLALALTIGQARKVSSSTAQEVRGSRRPNHVDSMPPSSAAR